MALWLVPRPEADAERTREALAAAGHRTVAAPVIAIDGRDPDTVDLTGVQAVLFTSANGVRAFARLSPRRDLPVLAVGPASAEEARRAGFADVASAAGDATSLADLVRRTRDPAAGVLFHAAGRDTAGDLVGWLTGSGYDVRRRVLYRAAALTQLPEVARRTLDDPALAGVLFFSPRTAGTFVRLVREAGMVDRLARLAAVCLSPAVAGRLDRAAWADVRIAERPDMPALVDKLDPPLPSPVIGEPARMASRNDKTETGGPAGETPAGKPEETAGKPEETAGKPGETAGIPAGGVPERPEDAPLGAPETAPEGEPADTDDPPAGDGGTAAGQVIEAFGGIRPMAGKLGAPVTTVQGWKKRGHIPPSRRDDIQAAAARHGIDLDPALLSAAVTEAEAAERGEAVSVVEAQPADTERAAAAGGGESAAEATPEAAGMAPGETGETARADTAQPWGATAVPGTPDARPAGEEGGGAMADEAESRRAETSTAAAPPYQPPPKTGRGIAWLALLVAVIAGGGALWLAYARPPANLPGPTDRLTALQDRIAELEEQAAAAPAPDGALAERVSGLEQRVEALPAEVSARLAALESQVQAVEAAATAAEPPDLSELQDRVAGLEQLVREGGAGADAAVGQAAEDVAALRGELGDLSRTLSGRLDELTAAVDETRGAAADRVGDVAGRVDALADRIDGLAGRLEPVAGRVDELAARLDTVAQAVERLSASDTATQALVLAVGQLRDALESGPFADALDRVRALVGDQPDLAEALAEIAPQADAGIPTRAVLTARYPAVAREIRQAAAAEREGDWMDRSMAAVRGLVTVRREDGEVQGDDAGAITSRAAGRLENGNLQGAVDALAELEGAAADAAAPWLADASARLAAEAVLDRLTLEAVDRLGGLPTGTGAPAAPSGAGEADADEADADEAVTDEAGADEAGMDEAGADDAEPAAETGGNG